MSSELCKGVRADPRLAHLDGWVASSTPVVRVERHVKVRDAEAARLDVRRIHEQVNAHGAVKEVRIGGRVRRALEEHRRRDESAV